MQPLLPALKAAASRLPSASLLGPLLLIYELKVGKWKFEGSFKTKILKEKSLDMNLCSLFYQQNDLGLLTTCLSLSVPIIKTGSKHLFR